MFLKSKQVVKMSNQTSYLGDRTDAQAELLLSLLSQQNREVVQEQ